LKRANYFAVIPAAGVGSRIGGAVPKQYVPIGHQTMLAHAIDALAAEARIREIVVVVAADDQRWQAIERRERVRFVTQGGATRATSVRNGLRAIAARDDDWVLVHDAARPCLSRVELARLIDDVGDDAVGGLLAAPLADTLKRARDDRVVATLERAQLWRALTPQMFRFGLLRRALESDAAFTDESNAVEQLGLQPKLVAGAPGNLKVTLAEDFLLAAAILKAQGRIA
jgi:2-C-methyl-D-erythritol 4-phosphate cytidylyltransferase